MIKEKRRHSSLYQCFLVKLSHEKVPTVRPYLSLPSHNYPMSFHHPGQNDEEKLGINDAKTLNGSNQPLLSSEEKSNAKSKEMTCDVN